MKQLLFANSQIVFRLFCPAYNWRPCINNINYRLSNRFDMSRHDKLCMQNGKKYIFINQYTVHRYSPQTTYVLFVYVHVICSKQWQSPWLLFARGLCFVNIVYFSTGNSETHICFWSTTFFELIHTLTISEKIGNRSWCRHLATMTTHCIWLERDIADK